jgi:hypothetical protein
MLLNNRWLSTVTNQPKIARNTKLMMTKPRHSGGFFNETEHTDGGDLR